VRIGSRDAVLTAATRLSALPRMPASSVVLAGILVGVLWTNRGSGYHGLTYTGLLIVVFAGLAIGWIVLDRLAALPIPPPMIALLVTAVAFSGWLVATVGFCGSEQAAASSLAIGAALGGLIRGITDARRSMASFVALATAAAWLVYEIPYLPFQPVRDFHLYLGAGATALGGGSPYLTQPLTAIPALVQLPFVYPPLTIPLFELLASLPGALADGLWEVSSVAAVIGGLWLLGVRGRWLVVLLAWPPLALGIAVGNVASFMFLLYAAGFRFGAALLLSGIFKVQAMIPTLWLVRERRWRELAAGVAVVVGLALLSVPVVGVHTWLAWPTGLQAFAMSAVNIPDLQANALAHWQGPLVALAITVALIVFALVGRGRNSLARFGLASIVGSPTLYLHGLSPLLAGALVLGPELLWFFLGLGTRGIAFGTTSIWFAMAVVGLTLLVASDGLDLPRDLTPSRADLHPLGRSGQVWPPTSKEKARQEHSAAFDRDPSVDWDGIGARRGAL
jgi:hypothetical protein